MININDIKNDKNIERIEDYVDLIEVNPKFNEGNIILRTINCQNEKSCEWYHDFISIFNDCTLKKLNMYSKNVIIKYNYVHKKGDAFITIEEYKECMEKCFLKNFKLTSILVEELKGGWIDIHTINEKLQFDAPPVMYNENTNKFNIEDYYDSPIQEIRIEKSFNMNKYITEDK